MENQTVKKNKIIAIILSVLFVLNLTLSCVLLVFHFTDKKTNENELTKYTLYIGTNDKDTYQPVYDFDVCVEKVTNICVEYTGGCTIYEAAGYWKDDDNNITKEKTIVCILEDIEKEKVYKICDEVIIALNQNSILVETNKVTSLFYSTNK